MCLGRGLVDSWSSGNYRSPSWVTCHCLVGRSVTNLIITSAIPSPCWSIRNTVLFVCLGGVLPALRWRRSAYPGLDGFPQSQRVLSHLRSWVRYLISAGGTVWICLASRARALVIWGETLFTRSAPVSLLCNIE